jgi:hypothetical protein
MELFTIEWHEDCLKNQKLSLEHLRRKAERAIGDVERAKKGTEFYELQIETAKAQKKEKFDRDRFMIRRKKGE